MLNTHNNSQLYFFPFIAMLYITIKLTCALAAYKIISVGPFTAPASCIILPLWFFMGDIIAEVYGYETSKKLIWAVILAQVVFASLGYFLANLPSPDVWPYHNHYVEVLKYLPRETFASCLAILCGASVNAYVISRWKILMNGRYFWARCLGATAIGEAVFTIVIYIVEFAGLISFFDIVKFIAISYLIKILIFPIVIIPTIILANFLKRWERIDSYDYNIKFNPFKLLS